MRYLIRSIEADEWRELKELRLTALADPAAPTAFQETYEQAAGLPDDLWQERAQRSAAEDGMATFVAEDCEGLLVGMVVALLDDDGADPVATLAGVYVDPDHRGVGLARRLFRAAVEWCWEVEKPRVGRLRLWVHQDNAQGEALYRRAGFTRSGDTVAAADGSGSLEYAWVLPRP